MSYLDSQISGFKTALNSSSTKISSKRAAAGPTKIIPLSKPSVQASTSNPKGTSKQQVLKRKRPDQNDVVYSQPADTGTGRNIMTQVTYAIEYLKTKGTPQTLTDLLSYLSLQNRESQYKLMIARILRSHEKVDFQDKQDGGEGTYSFRPVHNIRSPERLLGHLQSQPTAQGLNVRELRDGWPDAEDAINKLEAQGKLLVTRNKKDNHAKMVWPNDPSLAIYIDDEFQAIWQKIKLPEAAAVADDLEKAGLTPANKNRGVKVKAPVQEKKKKKPRIGGKTTNTHMLGVLRDYSHLKK